MTDDGPRDGGGELTESERVERRELARGHLPPEEEPVEPRPAATMVLARAGQRAGGAGASAEGGAPDVLFLRRPEEARFAAGAWVFPGGVVDDEDRTAGLGERFGPGVTREEPAALVAALREGFEETGLLPSDAPPPPAAAARERDRLLAGETDFGSLVRRLDLEFGGLEAVYLARWITPPRLSRRYDARFFLVRHRGGEPRLIHDEHTEAVWLPPAEAMRRFETGDFPMLYPTRRTVETLAGLGTLGEAFEAVRGCTVAPRRPRLLVEDGAVIPVLPGHPRYGEAARDGEGEGRGRSGEEAGR